MRAALIDRELVLSFADGMLSYSVVDVVSYKNQYLYRGLDPQIGEIALFWY
jgi:hypothetical protein